MFAFSQGHSCLSIKQESQKSIVQFLCVVQEPERHFWQQFWQRGADISLEINGATVLIYARVWSVGHLGWLMLSHKIASKTCREVYQLRQSILLRELFCMQTGPSLHLTRSEKRQGSSFEKIKDKADKVSKPCRKNRSLVRQKVSLRFLGLNEYIWLR